MEEYEAFERVEGGDLNWIVPKKLVAFAGPSARRMESYGYKTHVPEDYVPYFKARSVSAVVRLNNKVILLQKGNEKGTLLKTQTMKGQRTRIHR